MPIYNNFLDLIQRLSVNADFKTIADEIFDYLSKRDDMEFVEILENIGTIPERITHDSTEEKVYSKASDVVLSNLFQRIGLKSKVINERADAADIVVESICGHGYSLVADAKCFRLSRTAKNQKDFKVSNLSDWRGQENDYAILVAPYFQYPAKKSQIYSKALENNVCLLSWEQCAAILISNKKETVDFSFEQIWNSSSRIAKNKKLAFSDRENYLLDKVDEMIMKKISMSKDEYYNIVYTKMISVALKRCDEEMSFWENKKEEVKNMSKEEAISELITSLKLNEKINTIKRTKKRLSKYSEENDEE